MNNALIVSSTDKSTAYFTDLLNEASVNQIVNTPSCAQARRLLSEEKFDLLLINSPLKDETGEQFARSVSSEGHCQVILIVKSRYYDKVSAACEGDGVLTIAKPLNKTVFQIAIQMAKSVQSKMLNIQSENEKLKQKTEDIRIVDRAKCILISYMNMNEKEAHRYIEKQAMDMRTAKRTIAEGILRTYEN